MKRSRGGACATVARAVSVLAALFLCLGPPLDAIAHTASVAVEAGRASTLLKLVSAFDVIDDGLDQLPGAPDHDQRQLVAAPFSLEAPVAFAAPVPRSATWELTTTDLLHSLSPDRLERPPRT